MHLKQIQIVGFKSFADRSKLDFEPGLMAVVGPNGCGKSNIIDAFRWCLGEMSAKSLRSSQMLDVVFNGSGTRPPQNMAEVVLVFDNSDRRLPINYSDVSISRRIFRSGESEYFINKVQCRLRDIRELFLDTGMGEDGYSSMEQGRVEWVLQSKPEQRRELFEEAAGVSKYRARREEALRKLNRVEIDLNRISDIVSVNNEQIRRLENAVKKATKYEELKTELKGLEISDWLFQKDNVGVEMAQLSQKLEELGKRHEELNTQEQTVEAALAESRRRMAETEEELLQANGVLSSIDADIRIGEERQGAAQRRQGELSATLESLKQSIEQESLRIEELKTKEQTQETSLLEFRQNGEGIEESYAEAVRVRDEALANLEAKRDEIKRSRELMLEKGQRRIQVQKDLNEKSDLFSRKENSIENATVELEKTRLLLTELEAGQNRLLDETNQLKTRLEQATLALEELTQKSKSLKDRETADKANHLSISEEIAQLEGRIHSLEEQEDKDPYLAGVKFVLEAGLPGVYGPVGTLFQCSDSDRDLVSAAIGERLGDLVAETQEDAERVISLLSNEKKGRARVWILDRLSAFSPESLPSGALLNKIQVDDKFKGLLARLGAGLEARGGQIYGDAVVNGGVEPSEWPTHAVARVREFKDKLQQKIEAKQFLETDLIRLGEEIHAASLEREGKLKEQEEIRIRFEMTERDLQTAIKNVEESRSKTGKLESDINEAQAALNHLSAERSALQTELETLHQEEKSEHEKLDIAQHDLTELQNKYSETNANLSAAQERRDSYQEKLKWNQSVLDHTKAEIANLTDSVQSKRANIGNVESELETTKQNEKEAHDLIQGSLEKRESAAGKVAEIQSGRVEISNLIQEKEQQTRTIRKELNEVQETIQNGKIEEHDLQNRVSVLSQKLQEQYELTFEQAASQFEKVQADPEHLEKVKKRVSNMGPINLAAPQEHAELVEKNSFLENQQADLAKAKDDLKQVISKINATTKEHFRETFEKVRTNFRTLYAELFRGGEADLKLTNEADILNSGVDIFCQPPGKKVMHISLLSGGEKALTACALLFAFFQVRPSPVALLDEVDAPLDEANVVRYVEMVKKFSEKTQFLVITHNKRTMEAANTLYGVTMEEFGVSKVLSARLSKAENPSESTPEKEPANA